MLFYSEIQRNKGNINIDMKNIFILLIFLSLVSFSSANSFEKGKDSFLNNNPVEAAIFFEQALKEEPSNENVFMYLGLSYVQSGFNEKGISTFLDGADLNGIQKGHFYLNAGNVYFSLNEYDDALDIYNLIIDDNLPEKGDALLNRANILMNKEELTDAVFVYKEYLIEEPGSDQKEKIVRLIALIETKLEEEALEAERSAAEAERLRLAEEQRQADAAAEAERIRLAEERRKADEAARQQALMDEILSSLSTIGDETQNISADSETIIHTDEESDIDD